ncbi:unnamed protein product [Adineta steineri]|uniref:Uncharacterized protein n=1 Tax=Adineta steineri TaxID=433720 RepID=A0A814MIR1_9BILA|nr:unnamed protein product [Adineta steineri]
MLTESTTIPSIWFVEPSEDSRTKNDDHLIFPCYPHRSFYKAELLINEHLKNNWNTCWTKVLAVNELIIGLLILTIGILIVLFQFTLSTTGHGLWTGTLVFIAGLFAFFTIIYRHHRFFLLVASIHILTGLASTILIFISIFALALQMNNNNNNNSNFILNINDRQLNYGLHVTLIALGLYEKLLCYTFLIMIIRHTHKMV